MTSLRILTTVVGLSLLCAACATAQQPPATAAAGEDGSLRDVPVSVTLFQNVRIFDGKSDRLSGPTNVLVRGNVIQTISAEPIPRTLW